MTVLDPADLWHTGIVVDDLDAAKADLSATLGVTWIDGGAEVCLITDDGARAVTTAYALSRQGPHHIELGAAMAGTVWTVTSPGAAHHVGYWVDDVAVVSDELAAAGSPRLATIAMAPDAPAMCAYHRSPSGLIVEIVTRRMKPMLLPADTVEHPTTGAADG